MMNILEEAIVYATIMHQGKVRKFKAIPFILHPLEVAQILATMTDDQEIITAGILHDIVEETDGTLSEIEKRFGRRVAHLVSSVTEKVFPEEERTESWQRRKESSLHILQNSKDNGVRMITLADTLANIRSLARMYSESGDIMWEELHQRDPSIQGWYYRSVAEALELSLNKTGAFKELIKHINFIWPGSFDSEKARYKKYREVSVDGCEKIGHGAKSDVYRYDDELVIKVFNQNNTYHDVEKEIAQSRQAFILGLPTAISFGIVSVGDRYGAMYELVNSETVSERIARSPGQVGIYANIMADLALSIHSTEVSGDDGFPDAAGRVMDYIDGGIGREDSALGEKCRKLFEALPPVNTLVHGDFHTNNVFMQNDEPILIDMDRISIGHPIVELSDLYYFYVFLGEEDPSAVEKFMGFSYETACTFFDLFLKRYLGTEDGERLREVKQKASLLCCSRMIRKLCKNGKPSGAGRELISSCVRKISELTSELDTLVF